MKKGNLFVVSGPSGVGKNTIVDIIEEEMDTVIESVSMTSRSTIRDWEKEGVHYYFVTRDEFEQAIERGELLEYNIFADNYYGTPKKQLEEKLNEGLDVIMVIDVNGMKNVLKQNLDCTTIFIVPPTFEILEKRLRNRKTDTEEAIQMRLNHAKEELKITDQYDHVVTNDVLEKTIQEIKDIIIQKRETI